MLVGGKMERLKDERKGLEEELWFEAQLKMDFVATVALPDPYMGEQGCLVMLLANIRQYLVVSYIVCLWSVSVFVCENERQKERE